MAVRPWRLSRLSQYSGMGGLLPVSDRDQDGEIFTSPHEITVL
jgi:hypothetical protein